MPEYKIAIVAPVHIQPSENWVNSLRAISDNKPNVQVIIVDDSNGKVILPASWTILDYAEQKYELGDDLYARFEVFHKSSSCKNIGHWYAWKNGADIIMGLDSDCIVPPDFIGRHLDALRSPSYGWTNPIRYTKFFPRGYAKKERDLKTILSLGLWSGELDLYGTDRVEAEIAIPSDPMLKDDHSVADGIVPLSGMNWAIWATALPALLFLPNFEFQHGEKLFKFRRHDDIWGGYIFQKLFDIRNERIQYGQPIVVHETIVDAQADADEEVGMIAFENPFYTAVDAIIPKIEWGMHEDMFYDFSQAVEKEWKGTEWEPLIDPIKLWVDMFELSKPKHDGE